MDANCYVISQIIWRLNGRIPNKLLFSVTVSVKQTNKVGNKVDIPWSLTAIAFYNEIMGGVDLADQMSGVYDKGRKSCKWWKKVYYDILRKLLGNLY